MEIFVPKRPDGPAPDENDEGLTAVMVIGRCSKCSQVGTLEYPGRMVPSRDQDKLLAYRPVKCFCPRCRENTEFVPIEVKKYNERELTLLADAQARLKRQAGQGKNGGSGASPL